MGAGRFKTTVDPDKLAYFVPVEWAETVFEEQAINEPGPFGTGKRL